MDRIEYAVLKYYPEVLEARSLNVGLLFHNLDTDKREICVLNEWSRLKDFDDEIDLDFIRTYLKGMADQVEEVSMESFDLRKYIRHYVNELRFSEIFCEDVGDAAEFVSRIRKTHLNSDSNAGSFQ